MAEQVSVQCCIAGGGPAGMMLGYLLARAGIGVLILEKHEDFLRDFRGDTVHPSTLEVLHELGLLDELLAIAHQRVDDVKAWIGDELVTVADFSHLPTHCKFATMLPQWDFLNFLADKGARYPGFALRMQADVIDLLHDHGRVAGLRARTPKGELEARADLVVACDGRNSVVRQRAGLPVKELGAPMDVLWFRLSRQSGDLAEVFLRVDAARFLVLIARPDHWQCGFVIPKGGAEAMRTRGLAAFRQDVAASVPFLANRVDEITSWDAVPLLSVRVDRLERWYQPGLLCIGDAAHAMSPAGGVGINLAIQDAVAAANLLTGPLRHGPPSVEDLRRVQRRRLWPTRATQRVQVILATRALRPVISGQGRNPAQPAARLLKRVPFLTRIIGRLVGLGPRPEHVRTVEW